MPQMNPIWWFSLFMLFIIHLLLSNSLNYFYINMTPPSSSSSASKVNKTNWKC